MKIILKTLCLLIASNVIVWAQDPYAQKFEQLGTMLPTPNAYRSASGAPGRDYWQQKADYNIEVTLDDAQQRITGSEVITYTNNAPEPITYLWVQLDQNVRAKDSDTYKVSNNDADLTRYSGALPMKDSLTAKDLMRLSGDYGYDGGFKIKSVTDINGNTLPQTINKTMMRVEIPKALDTGDSFQFKIDWSYNINDRMLVGGRSGHEYFPKDGNYLYTIAQWFPRMAVYDDVNGWQNKQFLGRGEFALPFGDYQVKITVPADHIVAASGSLQNPEEVLTSEQITRLEKAKYAEKPVIIVTEKEATAKEKKKSSQTQTWTFKADNVRDFAFASSRKFIWDAMGVDINGKRPLAMSFYPKEGNPLWEKYSTEAVAKTLETYSKYTIDYPYPVAISVHAASIGMEYPMICFNFGRPDEKGKYSDRTKYGMIGVIIHEVGHNYFPMIINSDERQWTWMDEGLNTFLQYRTQEEQYEDFPARRGPAAKIVDYMKGEKKYIRPIMTNSEQITQFGNNAYAKTATAMNILRETVMGPELFDYAFKEYARRWAFKHPMPADLFRTLEDASAVDLDWFWRGWFYSVDHVDIAIDEVKWYRMDTQENTLESNLSNRKQKITSFAAGKENEAKDFSDGFETFAAVPTQSTQYREFLARIDDKQVIKSHLDKNFYQIKFKNIGGLAMPIILEFTYKDGSKEIERIPAEVWRMKETEVTKVFVKDKEVVNIALDPFLETADTQVENNNFPQREVKSRFDQFKEKKGSK